MNPTEIEGKFYDSAAVIEKLRGLVLPDRFAKIESVVRQRNKHLITVMENIYDRGNTSAVMRSAEAFGFHQFHQIIPSDDFKESRRVTQGADKWLVQNQWKQTTPCIEELKAKGFRILVTHLEEAVPLAEVPLEQPIALCFGNEKDGASKELTDLADHRVMIPMHGFVQSFNISVAAALCFQQIHRELSQKGLGSLTDDERQRLLALYLYRSCKNPVLPPPLD